VLSTERLRAPITIEVGDASATVLAGTRLSELNGAAERHGLHLPIDLGADPCLGGMVATNTGGSRVLRHGPMPLAAIEDLVERWIESAAR